MKNLLIVSSSFPPNSVIGAQRPFKLAQHSAQFGWRPFVLTCAIQCYGESDSLLEKEIPEDLSVTRVTCRSLWAHYRIWKSRYQGRLAQCALKSIAVISKCTEPLVPLDQRYPWALRAAKQGVHLVHRHSIDLIWATAPFMSNLYAAYLIAKATNTPYVIDFRDVSFRDTETEGSFWGRRTQRLEHALVGSAAGISYVSPSQENVLLEKYPCAARKPRCLIYNWFDGSKTIRLPAIQRSGFSIVHGGSLYWGTRRIDHFFEALAHIKCNACKGTDDITFYQYGYEKGRQFLMELQSRYSLGDTVRLCAKETQDTFLSICKGADILLLIVGHDTSTRQHAGAIPGKLYDYFSACRPILAVGPVDCEAARMVMNLNRGIAVADDNTEGIVEAITLLAKGEGPHGKLDLSLDAVRDFESTSSLQKIAHFFSTISGGS